MGLDIQFLEDLSNYIDNNESEHDILEFNTEEEVALGTIVIVNRICEELRAPDAITKITQEELESIADLLQSLVIDSKINRAIYNKLDELKKELELEEDTIHENRNPYGDIS
jgi:hypothetical protein